MAFTSALLLTAAIATAAPATTLPAADGPAAPARLVLTGIDTAAQLPARGPIARPPAQRWMMDVPESRPAALPVMYATLGALQALDVYSTRQAIGSGAHEANPLMRKASENAGTMMAVKALATAGTIFFTERAWKKNRKGAVITMAIINGVMAGVTAKNMQNARR